MVHIRDLHLMLYLYILYTHACIHTYIPASQMIDKYLCTYSSYWRPICMYICIWGEQISSYSEWAVQYRTVNAIITVSD